MWFSPAPFGGFVPSIDATSVIPDLSFAEETAGRYCVCYSACDQAPSNCPDLTSPAGSRYDRVHYSAPEHLRAKKSRKTRLPRVQFCDAETVRSAKSTRYPRSHRDSSHWPVRYEKSRSWSRASEQLSDSGSTWPSHLAYHFRPAHRSSHVQADVKRAAQERARQRLNEKG